MPRRSGLTDPIDLGDFRLMISDPELLRITFERNLESEVQSNQGEPADTSDVEFRLGFGAARTGDNAVTIELSVTTADGSPISFDITYRLTLTVEPIADDKPIGLEKVLPEVAARVGPVVMYPYIRETLASLSAKAGRKPFVLPVMNVGAIFEVPDLGRAEAATVAKQPRAKRKAARKGPT